MEGGGKGSETTAPREKVSGERKKKEGGTPAKGEKRV